MASVVYIAVLLCLQESPQLETKTFDSLTAQGRAAYWHGHFAQSEALFVAALQITPRVDESQRAWALMELGAVYINEDELPKAEAAYREALAIYKKLSDAAQSAFVLRNLGAVYSLARRDDEALSV